MDTSVILSRFLGQPNMLAQWGGWETVYTSVVTRVEYLRTIDRLRLDGSIGDAERVALHERFESLRLSVHQVLLGGSILTRAAQTFPTVLGTLDALHLSSALAVIDDSAKDLTLLTHDRQLARASSALGIAVLGA